MVEYAPVNFQSGSAKENEKRTLKKSSKKIHS